MVLLSNLTARMACRNDDKSGVTKKHGKQVFSHFLVTFGLGWVRFCWASECNLHKQPPVGSLSNSSKTILVLKAKKKSYF